MSIGGPEGRSYERITRADSERLAAIAEADRAAFFAVYTFFARHPAQPWHATRKKHADFGDPRFGTSPDNPNLVGRRVDLFGRSLDVPVGAEPATAIQAWLRKARGVEWAVHLAQSAVVLLGPAARRAVVVWPPSSPAPAA